MRQTLTGCQRTLLQLTDVSPCVIFLIFLGDLICVWRLVFGSKSTCMKLPEAGLLAKILIYHCQAGSLADPVVTNFFHKV